MEEKRIFILDTLKIIATILIVFHHYQQILNIEFNKINFFGGKFYFGHLVELFFLISGFLMFNYIEKIKQGLSFEEFFINRLKRLLPLMTIGAISYESLIYFYSRIFGEKLLESELDFFLGGGETIISSFGIQAGWSFENPMINNLMWYVSVLILCYIIFYVITKISIIRNYKYTYFFIIMIFLGISIQRNYTDLAFFNTYQLGDTMLSFLEYYYQYFFIIIG